MNHSFAYANVMCNTILPWFEFLYYFLKPKDQNIYTEETFQDSWKSTQLLSVVWAETTNLYLLFFCVNKEQYSLIIAAHAEMSRSHERAKKQFRPSLPAVLKNIQTTVLLILEMTSTKKLTFPSEFQNLSRMTRFWKRFSWCWQDNSVFGSRTSQISYGKIPHPFLVYQKRK